MPLLELFGHWQMVPCAGLLSSVQPRAFGCSRCSFEKDAICSDVAFSSLDFSGVTAGGIAIQLLEWECADAAGTRKGKQTFLAADPWSLTATSRSFRPAVGLGHSAVIPCAPSGSITFFFLCISCSSQLETSSLALR